MASIAYFAGRMRSSRKCNLVFLVYSLLIRICSRGRAFYGAWPVYKCMGKVTKWHVFFVIIMWTLLLMINQATEDEQNLELDLMMKHTEHIWAIEDRITEARRLRRRGAPNLDEELDLMVKRTKYAWELEERITKARRFRFRYRDMCAEYRDAGSARRHAFTDVFHNTEQIRTDPNQITMVVHMTEERLPVLLRQLRHWQGPMSLSVYVKLETMKSFFLNLRRQLGPRRNNLQIHAIHRKPGIYPSNYLRNVALNATVTNYVFVNDIDFLPSLGAHDVLLGHMTRSSSCQVLVVPAFEEVQTNTHINRAYPSNKQHLLNMWNQSTVIPFHMTIFAPGHQPTDYERWKTATEPYLIQYSEYFEPYVVAVKKGFPKFDEHFVGRFYDKSSLLMTLYAKRYGFIVVPDAFLIHTWHPTPQKSYTEYACSNRIYAEHRNSMMYYYQGATC